MIDMVADNKLITVIAPRKINRINAIEQVVKKNNLKYTLWSSIMNEDDNIIGDFDIILVDCFGILPFFYEYEKSLLHDAHKRPPLRNPRSIAHVSLLSKLAS